MEKNKIGNILEFVKAEKGQHSDRVVDDTGRATCHGRGNFTVDESLLPCQMWARRVGKATWPTSRFTTIDVAKCDSTPAVTL